ncbi:hypothetical protein FTUN_7855 [Frigoriglobus tundricola]|uniref:Uncharacterized protein n=1 Tax=Frigoriglobus tundricola TaxID=2774151 RepID=A0A6M5Z3Y9_9BACT|nr:hypothetical protein FTUN_7855 [Frigoriglobus tundricola]
MTTYETDGRTESIADRMLPVVAVLGAAAGAVIGATLGAKMGTSFPLFCCTFGTLIGSVSASSMWYLSARLWEPGSRAEGRPASVPATRDQYVLSRKWRGSASR